MARSLNSVQLIGNLTRDPELRYTPTGTAVCTIGIATNRTWVTETGEKKEDTEFHRVVAWNKLAELCSQLLTKGSKVYFHGRLSTRSWTAQDGSQKSTTEIVVDDMIVLNGKKAEDGQSAPTIKPVKQETEKAKSEESAQPAQNTEAEVSPDDIPF